jgi:hypothetical protein
LASGLELAATPPGIGEWPRRLAVERVHPGRRVGDDRNPHDVGALRGITYQVTEPRGNPVRHLQVEFAREDLDSVRFETGDGVLPEPGDPVVWERTDFLTPEAFSANIVESRNLYTSLSQLLEMGPAISLLFLVAVSAVILVRQPMTAVQMLTIAAGYAVYFPLLLYLSSRFSFAVALAIAVFVLGALLVTTPAGCWGRDLVGWAVPFFLGYTGVFLTLAAFSGWNRGMVLLCLGIVTLWVLIDLQNAGLRRRLAPAVLVACLVSGASPSTAASDEVQLLVPGSLASRFLEDRDSVAASLLTFEPAMYEVRQEATHFLVEVNVPFEVVRAGGEPVILFGPPVHLVTGVWTRPGWRRASWSRYRTGRPSWPEVRGRAGWGLPTACRSRRRKGGNGRRFPWCGDRRGRSGWSRIVRTSPSPRAVSGRGARSRGEACMTSGWPEGRCGRWAGSGRRGGGWGADRRCRWAGSVRNWPDPGGAPDGGSFGRRLRALRGVRIAGVPGGGVSDAPAT